MMCVITRDVSLSPGIIVSLEYRSNEYDQRRQANITIRLGMTSNLHQRTSSLVPSLHTIARILVQPRSFEQGCARASLLH
jgi:hypothetical protein